uniref:Uncharacterized protein n=1 Tax=Amphimedon queenslandica TaxID=400682 RepID=A0A1X7TK95_AMPQE
MLTLEKRELMMIMTEKKERRNRRRRRRREFLVLQLRNQVIAGHGNSHTQNSSKH